MSNITFSKFFYFSDWELELPQQCQRYIKGCDPIFCSKKFANILPPKHFFFFKYHGHLRVPQTVPKGCQRMWSFFWAKRSTYLYLSFYLSVYLSIYISIYLSIYLSLSLSIYLSLSLTACLFVCLCVQNQARSLLSIHLKKNEIGKNHPSRN